MMENISKLHTNLYRHEEQMKEKEAENNMYKVMAVVVSLHVVAITALYHLGMSIVLG